MSGQEDEAAGQRGPRTATAARSPAGGRRGARAELSLVPEAEPRSYYGRPVLKEPVWKPEVPWYFFAGGLAGASAGLGCGARLAGNDELARSAWLTALGGVTASPALLTLDLGRPERFLNMLRVFKVTSPMSVGSWLLAATGPVVAAAAAEQFLGIIPRLGRVAQALAAALGLPLSTYTAVLIANTAVPVWHEARRELPFLFAAGAAASAGGAGAIATPVASAGPARRLAVAGALGSLVASRLMERRLGELAEPYEHGEASRYAKLGKALTVAGGALMAAVGRRRGGAAAGGAMLLAGSAAERWAVFKAGFQSSRDPKYVVAPQRRRAR